MFLRIISGEFGRQRISVPKTDLRPTEEKVRAALFNSLFSMIEFEGKYFLDLFAGSGAVGIEALSRGYEKSFFIEKNRKAVSVIKSNLEKLGISEDSFVFSTDLFKENWFSVLNGHTFDTIFIDPPYKFIPKVKDIITHILHQNLLRNYGTIIVESGEEFSFDCTLQSKMKKYGNTYLTFFTYK